MYGKIKDMRLINITVKKDGEIIYTGKVEEAPEEIKEKSYKKIEFEGLDVILEI